MNQAPLPSPSSFYLRLSVTDRCNFSCRYCRSGETERQDVLRYESLLALVARVAGNVPLRKVRITGGEPLVRRDLPRFVAGLRELLPEAELCLTTNGSLLRRHAPALRRAGLDRVNVSIDCLDPARFAALTRSAGPGAASVERILDGIAAAREAGLVPLRLNSVLMRSVNGDHLTDLVRTAAENDAELRFIELMPIGEAKSLPADEFLSGDEALGRLRESFGYVRALGDGGGTAVRHLLRDGDRLVTVGFITSVSHPFCARCDRLRLDSRGRLFSCLRREVGFDLAGPLRQGQLERLDARVRDIVRTKRLPEKTWPRRNMSAIGG